MDQNFLSNKKFEFSINRLPHVEFYTQNVSLPGLNGSFTPISTPFSNINRHGDKLEYEDLNITVRMDENLRAYKEIHDWLVAITKPQSYQDYRLKTQKQVQTERIATSDQLIYSDASLFVLNSAGNPNIEFRFVDLFPTSLSGIQFTTTNSDTDFATCDITFKYTYFTIVDKYIG